MATRKDFEAVAEVFARQSAILNHPASSNTEANTMAGKRIMLGRLAVEFADMFEKDNPLFDKERFWMACKV